MTQEEIELKDLDAHKFIDDKVEEIRSIVGTDLAVNALSGGVDSSVVTMLGHQALGDNLTTYFVDSGLMREGEQDYALEWFIMHGIPVRIEPASETFFNNLKGKTDPEEKRKAITDSFYKDVFSKIVKESDAKYLLHGTTYTDIEETVKGIKRQHNILEQLGIDPQKEYGFKVIEPLTQLRKRAVRAVAAHLGLPEEIYNRMPFPGPGLAARILGEVTREKVELVRKATAIVEEELKETKAFQYFAVLHKGRITGMRDAKRDFGYQIEVRCWDSEDGVTATPTNLSPKKLQRLVHRITSEIPSVVSVTYNITPKPPSTIEAV